MTVQLCENTPKLLTDRVWEAWKSTGITSRYLTYIELRHLTEHFLKICREQSRDYREYDFYNLVDSNLNYFENRAGIENEIGGLNSEAEGSAVNKLKDYLTEEELQKYSVSERSILEKVEQRNNVLERKVKKMSDQEKTQEQIKKDLETNRNMLDTIMASIERLPNIEKQIAALQKSESFKDLGEALSPVIIATKPEEDRPLSRQVQAIKQQTPLKQPNNTEHKPETASEAPIQPQKTLTIPEFLKPKHKISPLDYFAGAMTFIIWVAISGWLIQSFGLTWGLTVGLAMFWITFIVVFRLMIGGILD
jgi:hypothetical protein